MRHNPSNLNITNAYLHPYQCLKVKSRKHNWHFLFMRTIRLLVLFVIVILQLSYTVDTPQDSCLLKYGVILCREWQTVSCRIEKSCWNSKEQGKEVKRRCTQIVGSSIQVGWIQLNNLYSLKPNLPQAWCILGKHYQVQRLFEKSLYPLKQCSKIDPTVENLISYGSALFDYGNIEMALKILEQAYNTDSKNEKAIYYYGLVLAWVRIWIRRLMYIETTMQ